MLMTIKLYTNMWGAAIITANYLRNRSPCSSINFKTPFELLYDKLPSLSHLRIFGCKAYALILNKNRNKLEPTAQADCIMIGYDESDGIYWIYNKTKRTMFRGRDIHFNEQIFLNKKMMMKRNGLSLIFIKLLTTIMKPPLLQTKKTKNMFRIVKKKFCRKMMSQT